MGKHETAMPKPKRDGLSDYADRIAESDKTRMYLSLGRSVGRSMPARVNVRKRNESWASRKRKYGMTGGVTIEVPMERR